MMDLDNLLESAEAYSRDILAKTGQLPSTFLFVNPLGKGITIAVAHWANDKEKHKAQIAMKRHMQKLRINTYAFVAEVFMSNDPTRRPSECSDKREGVIAVARDPEGSKAKMWEIKRDYNGKILDLEPLESPEPIQGWALDMI